MTQAQLEQTIVDVLHNNSATMHTTTWVTLANTLIISRRRSLKHPPGVRRGADNHYYETDTTTILPSLTTKTPRRWFSRP